MPLWQTTTQALVLDRELGDRHASEATCLVQYLAGFFARARSKAEGIG